MQELPLSEFRANAATVLDRVQQGQTVRILRHGKPVADLVPVRESEADRLPNWKQAFAPVQLPAGASLSQAVTDLRDGDGVSA